MGQGEKAKQVFANELKLIRDPNIQNFVIDVFEKLGHDWFWDRPCSLSGRYHPQLAQGTGGLVRHVKYGVWWGDELCRAILNPTGRDSDPVPYRDVVLGALILHDLLKDGDPELSNHPDRQGNNGKRLILGCHGVDLANAIFNRVLNRNATTEQLLICYGIAGHMGVWTLPVEYRPANIAGDLARQIAWVVHLADYCASRQADRFLTNINKTDPGAPPIAE